MAIRFGSGTLQFELVEGWERLPDGWSPPDVAGVCSDSSGNVFLYCRGDHPIIIYDREGRFVEFSGTAVAAFTAAGVVLGAATVLAVLI